MLSCPNCNKEENGFLNTRTYFSSDGMELIKEYICPKCKCLFSKTFEYCETRILSLAKGDNEDEDQ